MGRISRRILNRELAESIFRLFIETVIELKNPTDAQNFIEDLLSPTEKVMLTKRLAIAILLSRNYTYDEIVDKIKVSRPTIMNVSYFLKHGKSGYQKVINKIFVNQKKEEFVDKIEELLLKLSPPKMYGSIGFEKKQKKGKEIFKRRLRRHLL
ncbi:MAG: Trp family transcriptional regulator [Patescibacteria group bacterium]|nr:Trp family transcriptional regulator [Patescibacteria group bacterium]